MNNDDLLGGELLYLSEGSGERSTMNGFDARIESMLRVLPNREAEILATKGLVKANRDLVFVGHEILDIVAEA